MLPRSYAQRFRHAAHDNKKGTNGSLTLRYLHLGGGGFLLSRGCTCAGVAIGGPRHDELAVTVHPHPFFDVGDNGFHGVFHLDRLSGVVHHLFELGVGDYDFSG